MGHLRLQGVTAEDLPVVLVRVMTQIQMEATRISVTPVAMGALTALRLLCGLAVAVVEVSLWGHQQLLLLVVLLVWVAAVGEELTTVVLLLAAVAVAAVTARLEAVVSLERLPGQMVQSRAAGRAVQLVVVVAFMEAAEAAVEMMAEPQMALVHLLLINGHIWAREGPAVATHGVVVMH
jgi:hypothetical protein